MLTEGDLRVGSRAQGLAKVAGRTVTIDIVVTVLGPGVALGYRPAISSSGRRTTMLVANPPMAHRSLS